STWADFSTALAVYQAGQADGIGFALLNSELAAFDLDDCRDPNTGAIEPAAQQLIARAGSYTEGTPSNGGLRIIGLGGGAKLHKKGRVPGGNGMSIEFFRRAERFITVTGNALPGTTSELADIDALLDEIFAEVDSANRKAKAGKAKGATGKQKRKLDLDDV